VSRVASNRSKSLEKMLILFTVTLFVSSALLFLLQPMFAKMVLPLLGGTPAVWNTCVMFFQAALLVGYAYSHVTTTRLAVRWQLIVHATLLLLVLLVLPIRLDPAWTPPTTQNPLVWLIEVLVVSVGLPFFAVSTTAPLIQRWFAETSHRSAGDPYFLYAASNVGSIAALLSYPLLIEPAFRLGQQSAAWSTGYGALAVLTLACAVVSWRASHEPSRSERALCMDTPAVMAPTALTAIEPVAYTASVAVRREAHLVRALTWSRRLKWVGLSAAPSSLMLGVTTYLSTDIAAVPLLWVIPLFLYLVTFITAFSIKSSRVTRAAHRALPLVVVPLIMNVASQSTMPVGLSIPLHLLAFLLAALICHLELAASRPPAQQLTEFYLWMAVGGLVGGVFNTLLAPVMFTSITEYPVALLAAVSLASDRRQPISGLNPLWRGGVVRVALVAAWTVAIVVVATRFELSEGTVFALLAPAALLILGLSRTPRYFGAALAAMSAAGLLYTGGSDTVIHRERTFFGVYRVVTEAGGYRTLYHGTTLHGRQSLNPGRSMEPLTYYHRTGPIGEFLEGFAVARPNGRVGVIGLGIGSLVTYASVNQQWTFYEIDPAVARIASDPHYFTFLTNAAIRPAIVLGDARLSLRDAVPHGYDLLVLDAFSSDAIPVHLMTREALAIYLGVLAEHGALAFHISNRHLDLEPVLGSLAHADHLTAILRSDRGPDVSTQMGKNASLWLMMARSPEDLLTLSTDRRWVTARTGANAGVWTDDFSNIWAALKKR
jgi:spermidine synthase